jgi:hypothetical protein
MLWELVFATLLWEEVLIQDEAVAQSAKLADWFTDDRNFRMLAELINTGVLVFIALDPEGFPPELQEVARFFPMSARALQIKAESRKHGKPFEITSAQTRFLAKLDGVLQTKKGAVRYRYDKAPKRVYERFIEYFLAVLKDGNCDTWAQPWFSPVTPMRNELADYIENPQAAVERILKVTPNAPLPKIMLEKPKFTRNCGHLLAETYRDDEKKQWAINNLVHSAFAKAFCKVEGRGRNALGRYANDLHELLLESTPLSPGAIPKVRVQPNFQIPLGLPPLKPGLGEIVSGVRDSKAGRAMRSGHHGKEIGFNTDKDKWLAVVNELAPSIEGTGKQLSVLGALWEHGKIAFPIYVVKGFYVVSKAREDPSELVKFAGEILAEGASLVINRNVLQKGRADDRLRAALMTYCPYGVSDVEPVSSEDNEQGPRTNS